MFDGSDKRWKDLSIAGATNDEIRKQIAYEFGDGGGDNYHRHNGGSKPKVYSWDDSECITGKELIDMVREIFSIPQKRLTPRAPDSGYTPVQLALFTPEMFTVSEGCSQPSRCG